MIAFKKYAVNQQELIINVRLIVWLIFTKALALIYLMKFNLMSYDF